MPSPLGRVPPKGAGEERHNVPFYCQLTAHPYCGNTSSVLQGEEKSTFPRGEGLGIVSYYAKNTPGKPNVI